MNGCIEVYSWEAISISYVPFEQELRVIDGNVKTPWTSLVASGYKLFDSYLDREGQNNHPSCS